MSQYRECRGPLVAALPIDFWHGVALAPRCELQDDEPDEPSDACTDPRGHSWVYTGTAYGGDDERWHGEGRCYCSYCGADGDA